MGLISWSGGGGGGAYIQNNIFVRRAYIRGPYIRMTYIREAYNVGFYVILL